jgi:hypothetical protein
MHPIRLSPGDRGWSYTERTRRGGGHA